ncbi:MAG: response regulator transcription factor, partial [Knoellia sp.]
MRVLVVEDNPKLAGLIRRGLDSYGMSADVAYTGDDALDLAGATTYDVVLLDVMLPGLDGLQVCARLREQGNDAPVLMLTALDGLLDTVAGLDAGADDYLTKPFAFAELLARIRALTRRATPGREPLLRVGDLVLDPAARTVRRGEVDIAVTVKEFAILQALMQRTEQTCTRVELLDSAWDMTYENRSNIIDVYVHDLREKIDRPFGTT